MAPLVLAISLVFFALLQATIFPSSELIGIFPDVTLVIILVWSAVRGVRDGLIWAFLVGILLDTFVVRTIMVPAAVELLGDRVWWPSTAQGGGGALREDTGDHGDAAREAVAAASE